MSFLRSLEGREVSLGELLNELLRYCYDIRFHLTFSPDRWFEVDAWTYYAYPYETLLREFDGLKLRVLPFNAESEREWWERFGFGIVIVKNPVKMETIPVAFAVSEIPRKHVAIIVPSEGGSVVYTADEKAIRLLEKIGAREVRIDGVEAWEVRRSPEELKRLLWMAPVRPFVCHFARPVVRVSA